MDQSPDWARIWELFHAAREKPREERGAFLDAAAGDDADLRARVEALLHADEEGPRFLGSAESPAASSAPDAVGEPRDSAATRAMFAAPRVPRAIGHYHVKRIIASGGMGTVYEAVQEHPRRVVAVKVLKAGIASRSALRRFEYESQILARLHHPGIAQVYEAGTHDEGPSARRADEDGGAGRPGAVPFFAMEYIPNAKPITEYADAKKLGTHERLELFEKVCEAIHHGHQKGIIHRDLKPGNILVDADGQPKVIDFGVARSTDSDLAVTTLQTDIGQLIGTMQYMSPEQCEADPHGLDTRSDVYALGVVLYELLCGRPPYDLTGMLVHEAVRVIREDTPTRPSTVSRTLRGDVETIALKALEKHRERRYRSAAELGDDLRRYLNDEPIVARPPSATYRARKFVRRHRFGVTASAAVVLVLTTGVVGTTWQAIRAERALDLARAVNEFLNDDLLAAVAPSADRGKGRDVLMREVLDEAAKRLDEASGVGGRFRDKPLIEASIRATLGETYRLLGDYVAAEPHLERVQLLRRRKLSEENPDTLLSVNNLANLYAAQGRYDEAESLFLETLEIRERVLGKEHPDTLDSMNDLGILYWEQGRYAEAEQLYLETLEIRKRVLGEEHPSTLKSMNNLALLYWNQARYDEAAPLYLRTLEISKRVLGQEHPSTLNTINNLATLHHQQGHYDEAEPLYLETLDISKRVLGEEHPSMLNPMHNLAVLYQQQGRYDEAEEIHIETLGIRKRVLGEEHPDTLKSLFSLANLYWRRRHYDEAEPLYLETLGIQKRVLGEEHPSTLMSMSSLANMYLSQGRYDEAEPLLLETVKMQTRVVGKEHPSTLITTSNLANLYMGQDRYDEAEALYLETLEIKKRVVGEEHPSTLITMSSLAYLYWKQRSYDEAERLLVQTLEGQKRVLREEHPRTLYTMNNLAELYAVEDRCDEAEALFCETLEIRKRVLGKEHPRTLITMSNLAELYAAEDRYDEAEALFLQALEIRARVLGEEHSDVVESMQGLASLYDAWGKSDQAAQWRTKLSAANEPGEGE